MAYAQRVESKQMGQRERVRVRATEKDNRPVYLIVHSDILSIVKDNGNKGRSLELVVEYNSHH
jgi:hypothetical protein